MTNVLCGELWYPTGLFYPKSHFNLPSHRFNSIPLGWKDTFTAFVTRIACLLGKKEASFLSSFYTYCRQHVSQQELNKNTILFLATSHRRKRTQWKQKKKGMKQKYKTNPKKQRTKPEAKVSSLIKTLDMMDTKGCVRTSLLTPFRGLSLKEDISGFLGSRDIVLSTTNKS